MLKCGRKKEKSKKEKKNTGLSILSWPFDFYLLDNNFSKLKINAFLFIGGRKWILKSPDLQKVQWGTESLIIIKKKKKK